jgi:hypothetical protein
MLFKNTFELDFSPRSSESSFTFYTQFSTDQQAFSIYKKLFALMKYF